MKWPYSFNMIESMQAFYERLKQLFADVGSDMQEQKTRVDTLMQNTPQPSEVVDMRTGRDSQTYPVARDMVLGEIGKTEATQAQINADHAEQLADMLTQLSLKANANDVEAQIAAVTSGSPAGVFDTLASLQAAYPSGDNHIYIVTGDNGNWYYWKLSTAQWTVGGSYLPTGLADGSVDVNNLSDNVATKGYPFDKHALVPPVIRSGILKIKMYNADPTKQYVLASVNRNDPTTSNNWILNIYEWVNGNFGNKVCEWRVTTYTPSANIETIRLSGTPVFADILVNWANIPDGTSLVTNTFAQTGLHLFTYADQVDLNAFVGSAIGSQVKTKGYPFQPNAVVPSVIKNAILDLKLYNADSSKQYVLYVFRRNISTSGGVWTISIYEWVSGAIGAKVCEWIPYTYSPNANVERIVLSPYSNSNIRAEIIVDWTQVPDGTDFTSSFYDATGIHDLAYKKLTSNKLSSVSLTNIAKVTNIPTSSLLSNNNVLDQINSSVSGISVHFKPQNVEFNIFELPAQIFSTAIYAFCVVRERGRIVERRLLPYSADATVYDFILSKSYHLINDIEVCFGYCDANLNTISQSNAALASSTADTNLIDTRVKYIVSGLITSDLAWSGNANWKSARYTLKFLSFDLMNLDIKETQHFPKQLNMPHYLPAQNIDNGFFNQMYFLGRWARKTVQSTDCMYSVNLGSAIFAKIKGTTQVQIGFLNNGNPTGNPQEIAYSVDGGDYIRDSVDHAPFTITGLDTNEHYLRIVLAGNKDADLVWSGDQGFAFTGITVDAGATIEPVKPKSRVLVAFGDSISAGCWVLDRATPSQGYAAEENYVEQCCDLLRINDVRVAFSASGVTKAGTGGVPAMPAFIDNMDAATPEKSDLPDFITINMGTNDGAATSQDFQTAYQSCVNRIQQKYPGVIIFCILPFIGYRKTEIQAVVSASENTEFIDTTGWNITTQDGVHPDLNGSITAGQKLAEFLVNYFGKSYFLV